MSILILQFISFILSFNYLFSFSYFYFKLFINSSYSFNFSIFCVPPKLSNLFTFLSRISVFFSFSLTSCSNLFFSFSRISFFVSNSFVFPSKYAIFCSLKFFSVIYLQILNYYDFSFISNASNTFLYMLNSNNRILFYCSRVFFFVTGTFEILLSSPLFLIRFGSSFFKKI